MIQKPSKKQKIQSEASCVLAPSATFISEIDVGISQYLTPASCGFTAIIKHRFFPSYPRYSDFIVNEVDTHGNILHLNPPKLLLPIVSSPITPEMYDHLQSHLESPEDISKLKEMIETKADSSFYTKIIPDKDDRRVFYDYISKNFPFILGTDSCPDKRILIRLYKPSDGYFYLILEYRKKPVGGPFLQFILYKENLDTMDAINRIAKASRTKTKDYTFAGTKDKRAVTVQKITARNVSIQKLVNLNLHSIKLGNFLNVNDAVKLGDLTGNHFVITLRNLSCVDDLSVVDTSMTAFKESGFINYFGMQRFGTRAISTHAVGLAMLNEKWDLAIDLILMDQNDDRDDIKTAREIWKDTQNAKLALDAFPKSCLAERAVLTHFARRGDNTDHFGALQMSFVWNSMASERIRLYGMKLVKGDLVVAVKPELKSNNELEENFVGEDSIEEFRVRKMIEVDVISTDEDIATRSFEELVLPLPGYSIKYPENDIGEMYSTFMAKYGLDPKDMKRKHKETSLTGDYRKVINRPKNVSWKLFRYSEDTKALTLTDLDRINNVPEPISEEAGSKLALVCEFTLDTSSYATMALREVLKTDTGAGFQATLSSKVRAAASNAEAVAVQEDMS